MGVRRPYGPEENELILQSVKESKNHREAFQKVAPLLGRAVAAISRHYYAHLATRNLKKSTPPSPEPAAEPMTSIATRLYVVAEEVREIEKRATYWELEAKRLKARVDELIKEQESMAEAFRIARKYELEKDNEGVSKAP